VCYNVTYTKRKIEKLAAHKGIAKHEIPPFPETYWAIGFENIPLPVITNASQRKVQLIPWGLIPFWTKNSKDAALFQRKHLNARNDHLFSSGVWREPIKSQRCIIGLHGFYEYHHVDKKTKIPYLITLKENEPMVLAGLWDQWHDPESQLERSTVTIITTEANEKMKKIHNNPDVLKRGGPRMPLILPLGLTEKWLNIEVSGKADEQELQSLMLPYPTEEMDFTTVNSLAGKNGTGNKPEAWESFSWQQSLF